MNRDLEAMCIKLKNFFIKYYGDILWGAVVCGLVLFAALRPFGIDHDSINYSQSIQECLSTKCKNIDLHRFEPSFYMIIMLSNLLFADVSRGVLVIYAVLGVLLKAFAIQKYLGRSFFSLLVYLCLFYVIHEYTQIRAGVAIGIFLLSIGDIAQRKPAAYFIKTLFAILFHYSAIIMIPLYFVHKRNYFYLFLPFISMVCAIIVPDEMFEKLMAKVFIIFPSVIENKLAHQFISSKIGSRSVFDIFYTSKIYLFFTMFFYCMYLGERFKIISKCETFEEVLRNMLSISLGIYFLFIRYRVLALRPSEFLLSVVIVLIPLCAGKFYKKEHKVLYVCIMALACLVILVGDQLLIKNLIKMERLLQCF